MGVGVGVRDVGVKVRVGVFCNSVAVGVTETTGVLEGVTVSSIIGEVSVDVDV